MAGSGEADRGTEWLVKEIVLCIRGDGWYGVSCVEQQGCQATEQGPALHSALPSPVSRTSSQDQHQEQPAEVHQLVTLFSASKACHWRN